MGGNLEGDALKLHIAAHALCAILFLILAGNSLSRVMQPFGAVQRAQLSERLQWCSSANVYICFVSAVLNLFHITDFESSMQSLLGSTTAGIIKPLEYLLTCPLMMVTLVVLAGDAVPAKRQTTVATLTCCILILGFFASIMRHAAIKLMFFGTGVMFFLLLVGIVNSNVYDHSGGAESLLLFCQHGSPYKALCVKVIGTWVLFPIWWLLSAEGLNIVTAPEVNTLVASALNIFAKGLYVVFVEIVRSKYLCEDSLMAHPETRPHEIQHALDMAARLGPAGAIQSIVKSIETQGKQMNHIRSHMLSDSTKRAAQMITHPEAGDLPFADGSMHHAPALLGRTSNQLAGPSLELAWNGVVSSEQGVGALKVVNTCGVSKPPNSEAGFTRRQIECI